MSRLRASLIALAAAVLPAALAAPADAASSCAPTKLRLDRPAGAKQGVLRFKAPKGTYRVLRDGRLVGQTANRRLRLRVSPGQTHQITVARKGAAQDCSVTAPIAVRFMPPGKPRALGGELRRDGAMLSWKRGRRGDGKLAAYRILRDGATIRHTRRTTASVTFATDKPNRFQVVAVDRHGTTSRPASVSLSRRVRAPRTPTGLRGQVSSSTDLTLSWKRSKPGSGRIKGYRVFRDGAVVGQPTRTSISLSRLHEGRAYSFSVAAVNTHGALSRPSKPLTVSTAPPAPTTGSAHAFLLASTGKSFEDFRRNYKKIGTVYPTYFACDRSSGAGNGQITGRDDPQITQFATLRQVQVLARFDCQHTSTLHRILTEPGLRESTIAGLINLVNTHGYAGIQLDFEAGLPEDRGAYTSFVNELAGRLHAIGKRLSIAVSAKFKDSLAHPRSGLYDYPALAQAADYVFVMAWGLHWQTSAPGPQSDWPWYTKVVDYVASLGGDPSRYVIGAPLYGFDWAGDGGPSKPGTPLEHDDVVALAGRVGATPRWDEAAREGTFTYTDGSGETHTVWFTPARAVAERFAYARSKGFGIGVWRLGREDQTVWDSIP